MYGGWCYRLLFDPNCRPLRVLCSRWSWTTTWGWKSSLQLDSSQYPPAREITRQSLRWAREKLMLCLRLLLCSSCLTPLESDITFLWFPILTSSLALTTSAVSATLNHLWVKWSLPHRNWQRLDNHWKLSIISDNSKNCSQWPIPDLFFYHSDFLLIYCLTRFLTCFFTASDLLNFLLKLSLCFLFPAQSSYKDAVLLLLLLYKHVINL